MHFKDLYAFFQLRFSPRFGILNENILNENYGHSRAFSHNHAHSNIRKHY